MEKIQKLPAIRKKCRQCLKFTYLLCKTLTQIIYLHWIGTIVDAEWNDFDVDVEYVSLNSFWKSQNVRH